MKNYHLTFFILLIGFFNFSCSTSTKNISANTAQAASSNAKMNEEPVYLIFADGSYTEGTLDRKVEPLGGEKSFLTSAYSSMRYPPEARKKGVQGTVWISVVVNELGIMEEAMIKEGIGSGCDEEALRCIKIAGQAGFEVPMKDGKSVKVKYDIPTKFSLE